MANILPISYANCGSEGGDFESKKEVSLFGLNSEGANESAFDIRAPTPLLQAFGRSCRWAPNDFGYVVEVPVPGEYDVTLVFCETYPGAFAAGRRVFHISVHGAVRIHHRDVDVFREVGALVVHTIEIKRFKADSTITIELKKGKAEYPYISGFVITPADGPSPRDRLPEISSPAILVSEEAYANCKQNVAEYISKKTINAPSVVLEVPSYMFHKPDTEVRGLVVTFHGFSNTHYDHRILSKYLYDNGFDVFNTMIAGHMYDGRNWPATRLRTEYGGETFPEDIRKSETLRTLLEHAQRDTALMPRFLTKLRFTNPDFERVMSAQGYMSAIDFEEDLWFSQYYDSNHRNYLIEGTEQLRLLDNYPGPVHVCGLGVGGAIAIAVAALNPARISRCIALAPLLELHEEVPNTKRSLVNYIGPLGVAEDFGWDPATRFPVSAFTAAGRFGGAIAGSDIVKGVFKNGNLQMFMVLTEDEDAADISTNKKFFSDCGGRDSGHHFFTYPFSYCVPHPLLDPSAPSRGLQNSFYKTLYQNMYLFLVTGSTDSSLLLRKAPSASLPSPPEAKNGWNEYTNADEVGGYLGKQVAD